MPHKNIPLSFYFSALIAKGFVRDYTEPNGKQSIEIIFFDFNQLKPAEYQAEPDNMTISRLNRLGFIQDNHHSKRYVLLNESHINIDINTYLSSIIEHLSYDNDEKCFQRALSISGLTSSVDSSNIAPTTKYYEKFISGHVAGPSNLQPPAASSQAQNRNSRRPHTGQHQYLNRPPAPSSSHGAPPPYDSPPPYGSPPPYEAPPAYDSINQRAEIGSRGNIAGPSNLSQTSARGSARPPQSQRRGRK
ncbi:hypothetical protein FE394_03910 [Xenorhabdus sp. Reich]|uniref:Uncharacterized protein n=1 Tax=Xenorhabdus littoralis TaxID=2582835 RepID=A0ABU4SIB0_9GAMM|nr:hypothetical protein [Xenorhabdus sp. Reich]MDX7998363.1 hypothetical protein [Xenorhabdus sp. Reich]